MSAARCGRDESLPRQVYAVVGSPISIGSVRVTGNWGPPSGEPASWEFGCKPGDNIAFTDFHSPITFPMYALVDEAGDCIPDTYICAHHMRDPQRRLGVVATALSAIWNNEAETEWMISPAGFTGVEGVMDPYGTLSGPTFAIGGDDRYIVTCADCYE